MKSIIFTDYKIGIIQNALHCTVTGFNIVIRKEIIAAQNLKMLGSSTDFLFSKDLEAIFSLAEPDSFDELFEIASIVTATSCGEMQT